MYHATNASSYLDLGFASEIGYWYRKTYGCRLGRRATAAFSKTIVLNKLLLSNSCKHWHHLGIFTVVQYAFLIFNKEIEDMNPNQLQSDLTNISKVAVLFSIFE